MRHAIADSDDEDEEIVVQNQQNVVSGVLPSANEELATQGLAPTEQKSTGSTELLRRQLQSAARGLVSNSAPNAMPGPGIISSDSPSVQASKRRHTAGLVSDSNPSSQRSVKRAKTLKTCAGKRPSYDVDDAEFDGLNDSALAQTSQSATFTEHSDINSSVAVPFGTIHEEFLDHEPNVMFRDSGSTVMDDSSARERLFEQAVEGRNSVSESRAIAAASDHRQQLSCSWSPSGQDQVVDSGQEGLGDETHATEDSRSGVANQVKHGSVGEIVQAEDYLIAQPNPTVEIVVQETAKSPAQDNSASTQKTKRGRERKAAAADDDAEALVSDDRSIDLPQEQYKPRPTRRRATQVLEEPVDYSVRPEKAAKVKRTKSAHAGKTSFETEANSATISATAVTSLPNAESYTKAHDEAEDPSQKEAATFGDEQANEKIAAKVSSEPEVPERSQTDGAQREVVTKSSTAEDVFVKPPKPTQTKKPATKPKRSHTTIFEDHVEFTGSQRGPSLSQRQADRSVSLQPIEKASSASKRKRKTVVPDDEDEDGESSPKETINDPELPGTSKDTKADEGRQAVPKKRGRGRPPKLTAKVGAQVADDAATESENIENDQLDAQADSDKGQQGLSAKPSGLDRAQSTLDGASGALLDSGPTYQKSDDKPVDGSGSTQMAAIDRLPTELPTLSPEKQSMPTKASKASKGSPTSHSPINSTSKARYRVGLSKRDRIPSLLRTMNPKQRV